MAKPISKANEPTFESALERLEQIVEEMEGDRLALEDLLARYEEGTRMVKVCQQRLDAAEKRIELITRDGAGGVQLMDVDAAGVVAASSVVPSPAVEKGGSAKRVQSEDVSLF